VTAKHRTVPAARPAPSTTTPIRQSGVFRAQATGSGITIYSAPNSSTPSQTLPNPWLFDPNDPRTTVPQVFLVDASGGRAGWIHVLLPVRPNGSAGWVRASDVDLARVDYHVLVELGAHRITVWHGDQVLYGGPVAVGAPRTPTPTGDYYTRVLIKARNPNTVYGPYAYGLSSHSNALSSFNGGDAEIGLHGNDDASVLGQSVTHGCIRMDNAEITRLAALLPLGTPVEVRA
jgi:lipoprotein-anchoring transpeptidase ErfK/SrfK